MTPRPPRHRCHTFSPPGITKLTPIPLPTPLTAQVGENNIQTTSFHTASLKQYSSRDVFRHILSFLLAALFMHYECLDEGIGAQK